MKINQQNGFKSFGLPQQMKEDIEKAQMSKDERPKVEEEIPPMPKAVADDEFMTEEKPTVEENKEESLFDRDPLTALKDDFGVELVEEDFHNLIFKGYVEKDVIVVPSIRGTKPLIMTFKTLTAKEHEEADEFFADHVRVSNLTVDGQLPKRSLWILAFGVTKINGKVYSPIVYKSGPDKIVDRKETFSKRREVLGNFSTSVISRVMRIHGQMSIALNAAIEDPEADYLKKP